MPHPVLTHLMRLLDDTGIAQHATYAVVARAHGYCVDDNARGLILAATLARRGVCPAESRLLFDRAAAFLQHAWNPDAGRFRNFMGYDRRWADEAGSEDSHGRAVWALGVVLRDAEGDLEGDDARRWAGEMLDRAVPALPGFTSPRALACGLLGLVAAGQAPDGPDLARLRDRLAGRLCDHLRDNRRPDWTWFEASLSYDNARLPEAVLAAGVAAGRPDWLAAGLDTLSWLCRVQTSAAGCFAPVGNAGFWAHGGTRARFDQQPIEAAATISAALGAWRATGDAGWLAEARRAHAWFEGANDLGEPLVVARTGACRDGLHPGRVNANQGAESTLAWLQADLDLAGWRAAADSHVPARAAE